MRKIYIAALSSVLVTALVSCAAPEDSNAPEKEEQLMPVFTGDAEFTGIGLREDGLVADLDTDGSVLLYFGISGFVFDVDTGTYETGDKGSISFHFEKAGDILCEDGSSFEYDNEEPGGRLLPIHTVMEAMPLDMPYGNRRTYSVEKTEKTDSVLAGKTIYWLGSSVTQGLGSLGESVPDFIAKRDGAVCIKEAVSNTTLADKPTETRQGTLDSYVTRFENYLSSEDKADSLDLFVCQLSTNDAKDPSLFGTVSDENVKDISAFDKETTYGAIEYIIALVKETWDCPVVFYTNSWYENEAYAQMVSELHKIADKWDILVIDLYQDEAFNDITEEQRALYMNDAVHPTRAGYREWWLPRFEETLVKAVS